MKYSKGFTLLEILIAIAIMSMVLVALYSTFYMAHRALFGVDKSLVKLQESRAFIDVLKREIESVLYSKDKSYCIFKIDDRDFYGRQVSSLTMTSSSPLINGLAKINYAVEERDGILVMTKSMASAFSKSTESNRVDLMEDIESFDIQAKYQDKWVKTWDSSLTKSVPEEVKITVIVRMKNREGDTQSATPFSMFESAKLKLGSSI
jgi:general secretion pathway protein J